MSDPAQIRLRRSVGFCGVALLLAIDVYATGFFGGSERSLAVVRSIVLPGLPFLEWNVLYGMIGVVAALSAIGAWLRWGIDWLPAVVMAICIGVAAFVMPLHHHHGAHDPLSHHVLESSHEFTVVLVVFALLARLRLMFDRLPGSGWIKRQLPEGLFFPAVDVARTAALLLIAAPRNAPPKAAITTALSDAHLGARASRINRWARLRGGDPYQLAHAPLRAALSLAGMLDATQLARFTADARLQHAGVPASEPTWIRPLDGMLAALALQSLGELESVERWRSTFASRFTLSHGRRAAALHAPTMLSIGTAALWEHAAATALGRQAGWLGDEDWKHLRRHCLGKAASGARDPQTLRLIAAGKLWASMVDDAEAAEILDRRNVSGDPLALALAALANEAQRTHPVSATRPS